MKKLRYLLILAFGLYLIYFIIDLTNNRSFIPELSNCPIQFAHRGLPNKAIENSLNAIKAAKDNNWKAIEIDIQLSKDDHLVLFHDKTLNRLCNPNKRITELTLSEIESLNCSESESLLFHDSNKICSLNKVFLSFSNDFIYYLDVKKYGYSDSRKMAKYLANTIKKHKLQKRVLIASSDLKLLFWLRWDSKELIKVMEGFYGYDRFWYYLVPKSWRPEFIACRAKNVDSSFIVWLKKNELIHYFISYSHDKISAVHQEEKGLCLFILDEQHQLK